MVPASRFDMKQLWNALFTGDFSRIWNQVVEFLFDNTVGELTRNRNLLEAFLLFGITSVIIKQMSILFTNSQTMEVSRQVLRISFLVYSMYACIHGMEIARESMTMLYHMSKVLLPIYLISMSLANSITMASAFSGIFALIMFLIQKVLLQLIFPFLATVEIFHLVDHALLESRMHTLISYCERAVTYLMKGFICGVSAFGFIQSSILSASADVKKTTIGSLSGLLPGIGKLAEESMDIFWGSTTLIYRCMGGFVSAVLLLICFIPLIKMVLLLITIRVSESIMGMLSEDQLQKGIHISGETVKLMIRLVFGTTCILFMTIAVATVGAK